MEKPHQLPGHQVSLRTAIRWHPNQVAVTHHTPLAITEDKQEILASLDFTTLNEVLLARSGYHLEPFRPTDLPRPVEVDNPVPDENVPRILADESTEDPTSLASPLGKYLFPHPSNEGTLVVSFFHLSDDTGQRDGTPDVTHLINHDPDQFIKGGEARLLAAMPNWITGGTPISFGCPAVPPFPVEDVRSNLNWHIELPTELPGALLNATGKGVYVFVLDTAPPDWQIARIKHGTTGNALLRDVVDNVVFNYSRLPDILDVPSPDQPATGNDIYDRLTGFRMNDHGVFITGIIRDIAPGAQVECIRVLNDYAVGDTLVLTDALQSIQNRLLPLNPQTLLPGDLFLAHARVVVNLSLTFPPEEEALAQVGFTDRTIAPARIGTLLPMQALANYGVVFAASAGNGSGPHNRVTRLPEKRLHPDYPAAFAYRLPGVEEEYILSSMIPVGAVNRAGEAASYSNYPGWEGIGAYGGELPHPIPDPHDSRIAKTRVRYPVDALRGVYSNAYYPALSKDDQTSMASPPPFSYPEYQPATEATWAYWVGTSFATPIISALAARVLENQSPSDDSVRRTLRAAAPGVVDWSNLDTREDHAYGPMILVWQSAKEDQSETL